MERKAKAAAWTGGLNVLTWLKLPWSQMGIIPEQVSHGLRKKLKESGGGLVYSLALESYAQVYPKSRVS